MRLFLLSCKQAENSRNQVSTFQPSLVPIRWPIRIFHPKCICSKVQYDIGKLESKMLHCWCAILLDHFLSPPQNLQPVMDQDAIRCHIIIARRESNMQCQTGEGNVFNLYRLTTSFTSTSISLPGSGGCLRRSFKALRSACANLAESRRLLRPDRPPAKANFIETAPRLHHRSHSRIEGSFNTIQGSAKRRFPDFVNCIPTIACHFSLALPAAFAQPGEHLLAGPCTYGI